MATGGRATEETACDCSRKVRRLSHHVLVMTDHFGERCDHLSPTDGVELNDLQGTDSVNGAILLETAKDYGDNETVQANNNELCAVLDRAEWRSCRCGRASSPLHIWSGMSPKTLSLRLFDFQQPSPTGPSALSLGPTVIRLQCLIWCFAAIEGRFLALEGRALTNAV